MAKWSVQFVRPVNVGTDIGQCTEMKIVADTATVENGALLLTDSEGNVVGFGLHNVAWWAELPTDAVL